MNHRQRTRVKICGITSPDDAMLAVDAGADALGLVFYEKSPRFVQPEVAQRIIDAVPPFITWVGLFVDADEAYIKEVLRLAPIDLLQFHGQETEQACTLYDKPYIKAIRMKADIDLAVQAETYASAKALLLDSYVDGVPGGAGISFDWQRIPDDLNKPVILAGGLDSSNVKQAIQQIRPYAVDVSSGVENEKKKKDRDKLINFIEEAMHA